jgi:hypothetical protein
MNSYHRAETNRFLYLARLQLEMAANTDLRNTLSLPDAMHEKIFSEAVLHFLHRAYQHYLLEIAETTQCKLTAKRAVPMLEKWHAEGWYSDQLNELVKLETTESWLADLLIKIDESYPQLEPIHKNVPDNLIAIVTDDQRSDVERLENWQAELQGLIQRQRQFNQNW